jgi:hypothetical protein
MGSGTAGANGCIFMALDGGVWLVVSGGILGVSRVLGCGK